MNRSPEEQHAHSLTTLARIQAGVGAAIAAAIFAVYAYSPGTIGENALLLASAVLGALSTTYFLTLHQVFKSKDLSRSTLALSILTVINIGLVIVSTNGLDSPFYALWPLAIVVAGLFGSLETIVMLAISMIFYFYTFLSEGYQAPYFVDHVIQFAITLSAVGLAEWVHLRSRKARAATSKLEHLSGQLSTEQLRADAIMSSIREGVMVVDGTGRIQLFNQAAQMLTGWDEVNAQGIDYKLILQLKNSTNDQPVTEAQDPILQSWAKHESVVTDTLMTTTHEGKRIQLNISVSPLFDDKDEPSGAIALFRDVSAEKEVQRQKDEFVSTASHEMRTPVAAIEGYIALAMNPNVATVDDRAMAYLEKAHATIGHLGELFRDLLSITKAEEDQLGQLVPTDIAKLLQGAVDDMQFTVRKKGLTLVYQIGDTSGGKVVAPLFYVSVNPERLREVVMNLIDNANKFTQEGGIKVTLTGDEKEVKVAISDSGVGISKQDAAHLFQKFYRIDSSATRTIGGTGLGLYLCRRLIEKFNGRIWVDSEPGKGSTFTFTLPRLPQNEVARAMAAPVAAPAAPTIIQATSPMLPAGPTQPVVAMPIPGAPVEAVPVDASRAIAAAVPAVRGLQTDISRRIN